MGRRTGRTREFSDSGIEVPEDDIPFKANYAQRRVRAFRMLATPTERLPEPPSRIANAVVELALLPALRRA